MRGRAQFLDARVGHGLTARVEDELDLGVVGERAVQAQKVVLVNPEEVRAVVEPTVEPAGEEGPFALELTWAANHGAARRRIRRASAW